MIRMKVTGVSSVTLGLDASNKILGKKFQRALHVAGQFVKTESGKIVPYDTGALYKTRSNRNIGGTGWKAEQVVSYGNDLVQYAEIQHENEAYHHDAPRTHHYISKIVDGRQSEIRAIIAREMAI